MWPRELWAGGVLYTSQARPEWVPATGPLLCSHLPQGLTEALLLLGLVCLAPVCRALAHCLCDPGEGGVLQLCSLPSHSLVSTSWGCYSHSSHQARSSELCVLPPPPRLMFWGTSCPLDKHCIKNSARPWASADTPPFLLSLPPIILWLISPERAVS